MFYSREATANRAPGPPLVYTESGIFKSALVAENAEVAAAARGGGGGGDGGGDDDDDDDDGDDDDDDNDDDDPPGGGVVLVPGSERRSDHRGVASVTTIIGSRKRKAT